MSAISKEEVALYDRQIRLWGMEAQARLRSSSICFQGIKAVTLEACKNLVLAGVGRITLNDSSPITHDDLETQYYFQPDDLGEPRDRVLAARLAALNPLVDVRAGAQTDDAFDVVVAVGAQRAAVEGARWRRQNVKFVAADAVGLFGFVFVDCLRHEFVEEVKSGDETRQVRGVQEYVPLEQSLAGKVQGTNVQRLQRRYSALAFVFQAVVAEGLDTDAVSAEELGRLVRAGLRSRGIAEEMVNDDIIRQSWGTELVPCAAVVGGTLAQEVLKIVTLKDMPVNNWYLYDALRGDGITCQL
ncbi:SUMO-activating enzyme subunit 1 [Coemansia sp. RSA 2706]|nr:SUMO-activating enzyme subunit 1 [Coemansia sp. RSA 2706]